MATRAERQRALERLTIDELEAFSWAGKWNDWNNPAGRIAWILNDAEKHGIGHDLDRLLGLPTDPEQQLQLQRDGIATAKSSARAAWFSGACALLAIIVAVIALVVALGESG